MITRSKCLAQYLCALVLMSGAQLLIAHEIPERVQTRILISETDEKLQVLFRVPLEAMRDFDFPTRGRGYIDIERAQPLLRDAAVLWVIDEFEVFENGVELIPDPDIVVRVSLPNNRSFEQLDDALAHLASPPLDEGTLLFWKQALLDIQLTYSLVKENRRDNELAEPADFSIDSRLGHLGQRTSTALTFINRNGDEHYYDFIGSPGVLVLAPDWYQVTAEFVDRGMRHIWEGIDHILFLFCLILPIRKLRALVWVVTAFTIGHSITLISAALGLTPDALWFPGAVEFLIALSVVLMAFDNILARRHQRRWLFGFCFGLIHGFGFSFALAETLQFSGDHLLVALLGFNLGVEIGQLALLVVMLPVLFLAYRFIQPERDSGTKQTPAIGSIVEGEQTTHSGASYMPDGERLMVWVLSAIVAHSALHWSADQWALLAGYF